MRYLTAAGAGIVAAVAGWFLTGAAAASIAGLFGMSDFEGARGMFAFLAVGPIGGLVAMAGAAWLVLRRGDERAPLGGMLGRLAAVLAGIVVLVGAGIAVRLLTLDTYTNTAPPMLEFEIRVPAVMRPADSAALRVELNTDKNADEGVLDATWESVDDGRAVIHGRVPLAFKTRSRLLVVALSGQAVRLFRLRLGRDPRSSAAPGPWQTPDHVHAEGEPQPRPAAADDPVEIRYRVRRPGED